MYLGLVFAGILILVTGFLAGKEYDNMLRRYNANQRRRREEMIRKRRAAQFERQVAEDQRKFDYMYSIQFDGPQGNR